MTNWNIKQEAQSLRDGLNACNTDFERSMFRTIVAQDIREMLGGRKLTPGEASILSSLGIRLGGVYYPQ